MAKRRTKSQITADQIIKKNLNVLGDKIYRQTRRQTRVLTGALKNSINYAVKPDTVLTVFQLNYGSDVHPKKQYDKGQPDALLIAVKELVPPQTEVIKKELTESILYGFRGGK